MTKNNHHEDKENEENESQDLECGSCSKEQAQAEDSPFDSANPHPKQVMMTDIELKNMQKEMIEYKDKYLRLLADNEN